MLITKSITWIKTRLFKSSRFTPACFVC